MTTYGLTEDGLVIPTTAVVRENLNAQLRNKFGSSINVGDQSILGQLTGIIAAAVGSLWEKLEAVNSSQDPDKATGAGLDALCAITGTFRPAASYSAVTLTLTGTPGTLVSAQNRSETDSTGVVFVHVADATITAVNAWVGSTAYTVGNRVHQNGNVYQCITSGISAGVGGPGDDVSADIVDGTVHWTWLGAGTGAIDVVARAEDTGPVTGTARDIIIQNTSVAGWDGVINLTDASVGRDVATDGELRLLREDELAAGGNSTVNALRAALREIADVESVTIFVNNTDVTDVDGLPPHSVEALVRIPVGTDYDQAVFDVLLDGVAAGITTHGAVVGTAEDSEGTAHTMRFTRPTEIPIYVAITVTVDDEIFPDDGAEQIKLAIVSWGNIQRTGKDAVASAISAQAFGVEGVLDVTTCFIDVAPGPVSGATVAINLRELATYDTSRINVSINTGTP